MRSFRCFSLYFFKYSELSKTNRRICTRKIACGLKELAGFAQRRGLTTFREGRGMQRRGGFTLLKNPLCVRFVLMHLFLGLGT